MGEETCWYQPDADIGEGRICYYVEDRLYCSNCSYEIHCDWLYDQVNLGFTYCPGCGKKVLGVHLLDDHENIIFEDPSTNNVVVTRAKSCWYLSNASIEDNHCNHVFGALWCSECGRVTFWHRDDTNINLKFRYCPDCGGKILGVRSVDDNNIIREYPRKNTET